LTVFDAQVCQISTQCQLHLVQIPSS